MYLFHFFRSFLPLRNSVGFGASDFVEIGIAALLILLAFTRCWAEPFLRRLAKSTAASMILLAGLPIALRLLLLSRCPTPTADGSDDFSYLLLGDTLFHLRLANAPHLLHEFFETIFVLQEPSYSSIYPLGQGMALALGQLVFGNAWAGVLLSVGLLCALCYWMLRAWTTPAWSLAGGLLAVIEFGPLSSWTNSYWGGAVSGVAGCLVFGALARLREGGRMRDAALVGIGIGLEALTRPFEAVLLTACVMLFFAPMLWKPMNGGRGARSLAVALLGLAPAVGLTLTHNKSVTGSWTTLPYMVSRYQYGVPTSFTVQANPVPHRTLTRQQQLDYRAQSAIHGDTLDTFGRFTQRLAFRLRYYSFFFLAPLYLAALMFVITIREWRFAWILVALFVFALGTNLYPYFYPHYVAAVTCLCVLVSVKGLEWMSGVKVRGVAVGGQASRFILLVCASQFLFWYGLHLLGTEDVWPALGYETWDYINYGDRDGRVAINKELANASGKQLVFVRYWPRHKFQEWVHNAADIDASRVVWANDLGAVEDQKLLDYFRNRKAWLLEPDAQPPRLTPYQSASLTSHQ